VDGFQERVEGGEGMTAPGFGQGLGAIRVRIMHAHELDALQLGVLAGVKAPEHARADDSRLELRHVPLDLEHLAPHIRDRRRSL
jgi:hypothetical protein